MNNLITTRPIDSLHSRTQEIPTAPWFPNLITLDANRRPDLFIWNGALEPAWLQQWLWQHQWQTVPVDLLGLWQQTGGGDMYETETILGPLAEVHSGDNLLEVNNYWHRQGLPSQSLVFHQGVSELSTVHLVTGHYVQLSAEDFSELASYTSLNEWYKKLREEYAERYGLTTPEPSYPKFFPPEYLAAA